MNYIKTKGDNISEYRVYVDGTETEGYIVYRGHKFGVETNLLSEILDYRYEKSTGRMFFLKYDKVDNQPNILNLENWEIGKMESSNKNLLDSWISLLKKMRIKLEVDFRKIVITKVNI